MLKTIYQGLNELMITCPAQRGNTYRLFFIDSKEGLRQFSKVEKKPALPLRTVPVLSSQDYLRCALTSLVISNIET